MDTIFSAIVSNLECQIAAWQRKAALDRDETWKYKAEGLGYAIRLMAVFQPMLFASQTMTAKGGK
jgi:hypothetical protein